ncbi:MAG: hypothetical protein PGMFKBFP_03276 [Anaerolineales bacterium]|nr:hypothetical protein [Anaerolineales bacterium]
MERCFSRAKFQQPADGVPLRGLVPDLRGRVDLPMIRVDGQPRLFGGGESRLPRRVPLHRRPRFVAVDGQPEQIEDEARDVFVFVGDRVERRGEGHGQVGHADLLAVVHAGDAARGELEHGEQLCLADVAAEPGHAAAPVVVAEDVDRHERVGVGRFEVQEEAAEVVGVEAEVQHREVEDESQAVVARPAEVFADRRPASAHLAEGESFAELVADGAEFPRELETFGQVEIVFCLLEKSRGVVFGGDEPRRERVVAERFVFVDGVEHVEAESVHAFGEPEADGVEHDPLHFGVAVIQVGLEGQETRPVILPALGGVIPAAAAGQTVPIGRFVAPDVPVRFGIVARGARFPEPGMLVRSVIHHHVEDDPHPAFVDFFDEFQRVVERSVFGGDVSVVGNVVAEVALRRREERREPDGLETQLLDVIQFLNHAAQVADAVAVGVEERAGIDLIDGRFVVPGRHK